MKHDQTLGLMSTSPAAAEQVKIVLDLLSEVQYLRPHSRLQDSLTIVSDRLGLPGDVVRAATSQTHLDPTHSIGRLARAQLVELARQLAA